MEALLKDARYAVRAMIRQPGFTALSVLALALGIGANTAIFSVVNALLLRSLPYNDPDRIVSVNKVASEGGLPGLAANEYLDWQQQNQVFEHVAAYTNDNFNLTGEGDPERLSIAQVTANIFPLLGVQPLKGRVFLPEEDRPGHDQVVVVSEGFWQRRYGGSPDLIGKALTLNDKVYTVVGIMPESFRFPGAYEIWMPLALDEEAERHGEFWSLIEVIGRLRPGISMARAQSDLEIISARLAENNPDPRTARLDIVPLHNQIVGDIRFTVLIMFGAVGLVLLVACSNVANLMLARATSRQKEMAIRAAVGASRWRLMRQLLTESVLLGLAGGVLGVLLAMWGIGPVVSLVPENVANSLQSINEIGIDSRILGFTFAIAIITGVIFGLAPALAVSKPDLNSALKEGSRSLAMSSGWRNLREVLVISELALAFVLLVAAGLMVRSFARLSHIDPGFKSEGVLTMRVNLPSSRYAENEQVAGFIREALERIEALPEVQSAGTTNHSILLGHSLIAHFQFEGLPPPDRKKDPPIGVGAVSRDYFRAMAIPLIGGRYFTDSDSADAQQVAIINQALARRFYPNEDPLGKRISFGCKEGFCRTIVGVVGDIRQESLTADITPEIYLPALQNPIRGMTLVVRTASDPLSLAGAVRSQILAVDPGQPVSEIKTLDQHMADSVSQSRSMMFMFGAFAALALILAVLGIYGVMSYTVTQRTHEIGIRMALGARSGDVMRLIVGRGMAMALIGVGIGLAAAYFLTRLMESLLYGVTATDLVTFAVIPALLAGVAFVACYIPARRATRVDPMVALRYE
ncbi:MAG: ABC transporter permease [Blastocatellia bacterium]|nr:ABC transporter permease [Blastocatellia bacterium]